ncbi:alkaline phosphatase PhoX [Paenibacillus sp. Soil724D2]|uniref:alkaline phosphatase PhoX n=1 Tax=Paenibacillus sp. (strain Soil724D2) TaxID=1736392 RepID=UPI000A943A50|nr:alkaline phosphatase PhoX [Paenibacillus sp. Soil724D2]
MKNQFKSRKMLMPVLGLALLAPSVLPNMAYAANEVKVKSVEFIGMAAPTTPQDMAKMYSGSSVQVTYTDGTVKSFPLTYKTLFKTDESINGTVAGVSQDKNGKPIMDTSVPNSPTPFVSDAPDSNSLFKVDGAKATAKGGNPLSLITHYEYITLNNAGKSAYGMVPASMSLTTLDQNKTTGELAAIDLKKVDFSGVDGLWIPCNGSLTPWNTHLSSEEYEADARAFEADPTQTYVNSFVRSFYQDDKKVGNPYANGYIPEVTVLADNTSTVVKHYSMGRFSHELGRVAPDMKTVFFGDDGGNTMLFLYVADKAKDLSAGTLYTAKWIQTSDENGGSANLQWIPLGHATDAEVKSYVDKGLKFSDIFETADKDTAGFTKIKSYPSGKVEWLKVKPGMEKAAAFLESRRYGAVVGATAEFNKMEGVAVNAKDNKVYVAMSYVEKSMEKDTKAADPTDDIQVKKIRAGVTYELDMKGGQIDRSKQPINSDYVPSMMKGLIVGQDLAKADNKGNTAVEDLVANPDNLSYSDELRTLFIGEDSGMHANNFTWAYNVDTKKLSRILSIPAGGEATGLQVVDNLNGFSYVMSNMQHPGDEMILPEPLKGQVDAVINKTYDNKRAGVVGYVSGIPTSGQMLEWMSTDKSLSALRDMAEANGATVKWNEADRSVTVIKGSHSLVVKINDTSAIVDGQSVQLPYAARIENEKTMMSTSVLNSFLTH